MTALKILKCLLITAVLSCAAAHADDATYSALEEGKTTASFKISDVRCQLVKGQIRCTFGG
jgi:hypothetical protein